MNFANWAHPVSHKFIDLQIILMELNMQIWIWIKWNILHVSLLIYKKYQYLTLTLGRPIKTWTVLNAFYIYSKTSNISRT